ncbi:plasmolipin [Acanthopagrus latus]|uniref:plasmolipin n=1 Tax=Acanthopagrus latus TaxID=8177 RepID=UPI00187BF936|nr:plasmolipin [Acanthopagrus latus]
MADFPSKVTTETSAPSAQGSQQGGNSFSGMAADFTTMVDISFIRSIPAILMIAEVFFGLLQWSLIASGPHYLLPAYGWVLFVAIIFWILTIILFCMILFSVQRQLTFVPWPLTVMAYNGVAAVLYLTAFLANAASVTPFRFTYYYGHLAAAAFFGALTTLAYGASAFFSYLDWRGDGVNAATSTVPA